MTKELTKHDDDIEIMDFAPVMIAVVVTAFMLSQLSPVTRYVQSQSYQGKTDSRTVNATDVLSWIDLIHGYPYIPWIDAFFINDGPDAVEIAINYPNDRFTMGPGETRTVNRSGAGERIAVIFFICDKGEKASVRVTGEY